MALSVCGTAMDQSKKELTNHGLTTFPIACYYDDLSSLSVPWHWHDEFEFIIITKGRADIQIENHIISLMQGEAVFINSGILHNIDKEKTRNCKCHSLVFHGRLIGGSIDSIFWQTLISPIIQDKSFQYLYLNPSIAWQKEIIQNMETAWQVIVSEDYDYENTSRYHLSKAFRFLNDRRQLPDTKPRKGDQLSSMRLKTMIQYIEEHYAEEISLEMIADSASISKSVCLRCFRQIIGFTPIRYLVEYRIEKAAESLMATHDKVNEIAIACGFSDISYFSKCFRTIKGVTPIEYRRSLSSKTPHPSI